MGMLGWGRGTTDRDWRRFSRRRERRRDRARAAAAEHAWDVVVDALKGAVGADLRTRYIARRHTVRRRWWILCVIVLILVVAVGILVAVWPPL